MKREITIFRNLKLVWKGYYRTTKQGNNIFEFVAINKLGSGYRFFTEPNSLSGYDIQNTRIGDELIVHCYFKKDRLIACAVGVTKRVTL